MLGGILDGKEAFLLEIVGGQAVRVCQGLMCRIPLPEQRAQQTFVDLPQLAQGVLARAANAALVACCPAGCFSVSNQHTSWRFAYNGAIFSDIFF